MPMRAPFLCQCGNIVAHGALCPCRQANRRAIDQRRPTARQRGYTSAWDKARTGFLAAHPVCAWVDNGARCNAPATVVDHVIPHRGDKSKFWDRKNWQPLCQHHHNSAKQSLERTTGKTNA